MNARIAPGGPGDKRLALELMHDPRNQAFITEERIRRLTDPVVDLVAEHKRTLAGVVPMRHRQEWQIMNDLPDGWQLRHRSRRLVVIWSLALEDDDRPWLHVSCSHAERPPLHHEMAMVKELFVGDRYAYAVWPPVDRYVNLHAHVLHLWAPWWPESEGLPLPELSKVLPSGERSI